MYCATNIESSLRPYSWYHYHVVFGAKETGIPDNYLKSIEVATSIEDLNKDRDTLERAIYDPPLQQMAYQWPQEIEYDTHAKIATTFPFNFKF